MTSSPSSTFPVLAASDRCPCLRGEEYGGCCGPFHHGEAVAPTAERLMRSRYSAFVLGNSEYLLASWHPSTRPARLKLDPAERYYRLDIVDSSRGGMLDTAGTVEYRAFLRVNGDVHEQHEVSRFVREAKQWYYVGAV